MYPEGSVRTGETAFLQLVPALDVAFDYEFTADRPHELEGDASITAVVSDGAGWTRRLEVAPSQEFTGSEVTVGGTLDLAELAEIVGEMKSLTGSLTTTFAVRIEPTVEVSGRVGSDTVDETFTPQIPFLLDDVSLRVDVPADGSPALSTRRAEPGTIDVPARLAVGELGLPVDQAQRLAVVGLAISLFLLAFAAVFFGSRRTVGEHGRIASRFGDRMISIARPPGVDSSRVTDVSDFDSLARVAELHDRIVLHWRRGDGHVYLVDDGSSVYRYSTGLDRVRGGRDGSRGHARPSRMKMHCRCGGSARVALADRGVRSLSRSRRDGDEHRSLEPAGSTNGPRPTANQLKPPACAALT